MESTALAGDAQDNAADSSTMEYNTVMMNRQPLPRVKKAGTPSTTDVVESPDMNRSGTLMASLVLTTRQSSSPPKRTSTRALDIETRKTTANKIPLRFKEPQPCKLPPQFRVGIGV
ncbi:hypothetical protein MRX96_030502 [Rhipicephalus microplus]